MNPTTLLLSALLALLPISELRGAIPFAVLRGMNVIQAALLCTAINALVPLLAFLFLSTVHKLFYRWKPYKDFFDRFVERTRLKVHPQVEKYGYWGLLIFVAIPLPVTGAWTGTLGAWILGMNRKKAILAIIGGVIVAGTIVAVLVALLGAGANSIFLKTI
ncbi:MAG: small multi-drug export protein [Rectinemataceae bacterium]|nr:small multi-drug export protein [Rectinemataceae bacterium]